MQKSPFIFVLQNITYTFTVVATDNGSPETKNTSAEVTIVVFSPDNHFNPILDEEEYEVGKTFQESFSIFVAHPNFAPKALKKVLAESCKICKTFLTSLYNVCNSDSEKIISFLRHRWRRTQKLGMLL